MTNDGVGLQDLKFREHLKAWSHRMVVQRAGSTIADLVPVGDWILDNSDLIDSMARWRQESATMFLVHFESTPEKTEKYLREMSIADPTRILFIIYREGVALGHIGFADITSQDAELDNVMRGESSGIQGFMTSVSLTLLRWGFTELGIGSVHLRATSHNDRAISLYSSLGFEVEDSLPLKAYKGNGFTVHRPSPEGDSDVAFRLQVMRLTRKRFVEKFGPI